MKIKAYSIFFKTVFFFNSFFAEILINIKNNYKKFAKKNYINLPNLQIEY